MTRQPLKRLRAGLYFSLDHRYAVEHTFDPDGRSLGWQLHGPTGEWMQTYATLDEAARNIPTD